MKSKEHDFQKMESIINDLQADYANVPISGLFLVYPQYYIHVLEVRKRDSNLRIRLHTFLLL